MVCRLVGHNPTAPFPCKHHLAAFARRFIGPCLRVQASQYAILVQNVPDPSEEPKSRFARQGLPCSHARILPLAAAPAVCETLVISLHAAGSSRHRDEWSMARALLPSHDSPHPT